MSPGFSFIFLVLLLAACAVYALDSIDSDDWDDSGSLPDELDPDQDYRRGGLNI